MKSACSGIGSEPTACTFFSVLRQVLFSFAPTPTYRCKPCHAPRIPGSPEHDLAAMGSACVSSLRVHQHPYSDRIDRRAMSDVLRIWRFLDGKPGHENQSLGLVRNLGSRTAIRVTSVPVGSWRLALRTLSARHGGQDGTNGEPPDLLIGAGSRTHLPMLATRRASGARAIVLMAPPIPLRGWFDLCVVPEHDGLSGPNILVSRGALTAICPGGVHDSKRGLFLVGGPCPHYAWDGPLVADAIRTLCQSHGDIHWKLTTSRRTPAEMRPLLEEVAVHNLEIIPHEQTGPTWVPDELAACGFVYVTEDSVSMIYEAITSGASVGVLPLREKRKRSRIEPLIQAGISHRFDGSGTLPPRRLGRFEFDEANRIADLILDRLFHRYRASA